MSVAVLERKIITPETNTIGKPVDLVVIGGGMAGSAIAHAFKDTGCSMRVLEPNVGVGFGESTKSLEQFRGGWDPHALYQLMQRSLPAFIDPRNFFSHSVDEATIGLRPRPYLWVDTLEEDAAARKKFVETLREWGYRHASYLDGGDVRRICPWLPSHVVGGMYDEMAGQIDSRVVAAEFIRASGDQTQVYIQTRANSILVEHDKVVGVETDRGVIPTGAVIVAAGHHSRRIVETAGDGITIPVTCFSREQFTTRGRDDAISPDTPFVITAKGAYFRPEGDSILTAWANSNQDDPYPQHEAPRNSDYPIDVITELAAQLDPKDGVGHSFLDDRYLPRSGGHLAGYYVERTGERDDRALIASLQPLGIEGLYVSTAHSGHGVMTSSGAADVALNVFLGNNDPLVEQFSLTPPPVATSGNKI